MSWDETATQSFTERLTSVTSNGTGCLELQDAARERRSWVFLDDQDVVAVLVDGYRPRLARRLTASGFVSKADMGEVLTVTKDDYDPRIAVECVARCLVDEATMKALYREFMLSAASAVDEWTLGESRWVAGLHPWEGRSMAVSVPLLVNAIGRRKEHWARLWTEFDLATIPDRVPVRIGPRYYRPEGADEAAVLWALNGVRTLDEVAGECGFTRFQAGHVLAALMAKKVLDLLPAVSPRLSPDSLSVEAGYHPSSQPIPPDFTPETTQAAVTVPVTAESSEGNVVTQHGEGIINVERPPDRSIPGTDLEEFFVKNDSMTAAPNETRSEGIEPVEPTAPQPGLPPLPAITGGPSDFYAVLPSTLPQLVGGHPAVQEPEVAQLRGDLLRLAAERAGALEQATRLRDQTALHSTIADKTAAQVDEADVSIARLRSVTSEASATAVGQLEKLELARAAEARIAALRAQLEQGTEEVRKSLVVSQSEYDESDAAHAHLEQDLQAQIAQRDTISEAWRAATDSAVQCAAHAGLAEAAADECDRRIEEGRQRLTELANAAAIG